MSELEIPEEAVRQHAATLALREGRWGGRLLPTFADVDPVTRDGFEAQARRDLAAALPALRAAWEEELREKLLSDEAVGAMAAFMFPGTPVYPADQYPSLCGALEAALDTALASDTQPAATQGENDA